MKNYYHNNPMALIFGPRKRKFYDPNMPLIYYDDLRRIGKRLLKIMISRSIILLNDYEKIFDFYEPKHNLDFQLKKDKKGWMNKRIDFNDNSYLPEDAIVTITKVENKKVSLYAYGYASTAKSNHIRFTTFITNVRGYK